MQCVVFHAPLVIPEREILCGKKLLFAEFILAVVTVTPCQSNHPLEFGDVARAVDV